MNGGFRSVAMTFVGFSVSLKAPVVCVIFAVDWQLVGKPYVINDREKSIEL